MSVILQEWCTADIHLCLKTRLALVRCGSCPAMYRSAHDDADVAISHAPRSVRPFASATLLERRGSPPLNICGARYGGRLTRTTLISDRWGRGDTFSGRPVPGIIEAMRSTTQSSGLQVAYAAFLATRCVAIEGCKLDHVVQTNTAQRLSEFLLGN